MATLNITRLIVNNPIEKLSRESNGKLAEKINSTFTEHDQKLFLSSFWCYQIIIYVQIM
jgi:hypothetical protein